jgi:fimbrial chaperone protein
MKLRGRSVLGVLIVGAALSRVAPAFSSDFLVEPVVALLSPQAPSALLNLSNTGDKPVRFELTSYAWSQDLHGGIVLAPTDDVIFFPQLFMLGGGEQRKIRVGAVIPPDSEKSYRLFIEELPPLKTEHVFTNNAVTIRTRMGIPIFVSPAHPNRSGQIESLSSAGRKVSYQVRNTGNVHFVIENTVLKGLDAAGNPAFALHAKGWYVLAGQSSNYDLTLSPEECEKAASLELSIRTESLIFEKTAPASRANCAAPVPPSTDLLQLAKRHLGGLTR